MSRTKEEIKERTRLIRAATPDCLEELFEMQNRICDLCGHFIQDISLSGLDHSVSVIYFAKSPLEIEDAVILANSLKNLRVVHSTCNSSKKDKSRDEWFKEGLNNREAPRLLTKEELDNRRDQIRLFHRSNGLKAKQSGQLRKAASLGGLKVGFKHALDMMEKQTGIFSPDYDKSPGRRAGGRKTFENKTGIFARSLEKIRSDSQKSGSIAGRMMVESGKLAEIRNLPQSKTGSSKGGHTQGLKNVESGLLLLALHIRWHVNRRIIKTGCKFCEVKDQQ